MKHMGLTVAVSTGSGVFIFLLLFLFNGLMWGIIGGGIALILSFVFMINTFSRSSTALEKLKPYLQGEDLRYGDTAGLMAHNKELVGALAVTDKRLVFAAGFQSPNPLLIDLPLEHIHRAYNSGGFLLLTDDSGIVYRLKVFHCKQIIDTVLAGKQLFKSNDL